MAFRVRRPARIRRQLLEQLERRNLLVAPVAEDDAYLIGEGEVLNVQPGDGVLGNDSDLDGDPLTARLIDDVAQGTLVFNPDGSFLFIPAAGFLGQQTFTYVANDGTEDSDPATVQITVHRATLPVANPDSYVLAEDIPLTVNAANGVAANDDDPAASGLTVVALDQPQHGDLDLATDGSFVYSPHADFVGDDTFTYRITDEPGSTDTAAVTLQVVGINDAPRAADDVYRTNPSTLLQTSYYEQLVLADAPLVYLPFNDTTNTATNLGVLGDAVNSEYRTSLPNEPGVPALGGTAANFDGTDDYVNVGDINELDVGLLNFSVSVWFNRRSEGGRSAHNINNVLVAKSSHATNDIFEIGTAGSFIELYFDTTDFDAAIGFQAGIQDNTWHHIVFTYDAAREQETQIYLDGQLVMADSRWGGAVDNGSSSPVTIGNSRPDRSYLLGDFEGLIDDVAIYNTTLDASRIETQYDVGSNVRQVGVLLNDEDIENDQLSVELVTDVQSGQLSLEPDGSFSYLPNLGFEGIDSFSYLVNDGAANSLPATATIYVEGQNLPPNAVTDNYTVTEDVSLVVEAVDGVLVNDTDDGGATLAAQLVTPPTHGTVSLEADGSFTYAPDADYFGTDSFSYTASDYLNASTPGTVSLTITPLSDGPPLILDDTYEVEEDAVLVSRDIDNSVPVSVFQTDFSELPDEISGRGDLTTVPGLEGRGIGNNVFSGNMLHSTSRRSPGVPIVLELTDLPPHESIDINVLLGLIDSWDGASTGTGRGDTFTVLVDGEAIFMEMLATIGGRPETYVPPADVLIFAGENIGFSSSFPEKALDLGNDPAFNNIPHTSDSVRIEFFAGGNGWQGENDESWLIDNLEVVVHETGAPIARQTPVPFGSVWRYLDDGSDQGTAWRDPDFDDSAWAAGPAQLGYGDGDEATTIRGNDSLGERIPTTYFRHEFDLTSPEEVDYLVARYIRDDSLALYLNGQEVKRDFLEPDAAFDAFTAVGTVTGSPIGSIYESQVQSATLPPELLRVGRNVLAAEVHQVNASSSDVSFDLSLTTYSRQGGVLDNDSSIDLNPLTVTVETAPLHGLLDMSPDGQFVYTPLPDFFGEDSFTYTISDGQSMAGPAQVTINVLPVDDPSVANDDLYILPSGNVELVVAAPGVLSNDINLDADILRASVAFPPTSGNLDLAEDGSFTYTPGANFNGSDQFSYVVNDGVSISAPAIVTIEANQDDLPPRVIEVLINPHEVDPPDLNGVPQPSSWALQRSLIRELQIEFNKPVTISAADIVLTNLGVDAPAEADTQIALSDTQISVDGDLVSITWSDGDQALPDGVYSLELLPTILDSRDVPLDGNNDGQPGDAYELIGDGLNRLYRLGADWNGDRGTTIFDFPVLSYWFGESIPTAPAYADPNADRGVSIFDFPALADNFGTALVFPPVARGAAATNSPAEEASDRALVSLLDESELWRWTRETERRQFGQD